MRVVCSECSRWICVSKRRRDGSGGASRMSGSGIAGLRPIRDSAGAGTREPQLTDSPQGCRRDSCGEGSIGRMYADIDERIQTAEANAECEMCFSYVQEIGHHPCSKAAGLNADCAAQTSLFPLTTYLRRRADEKITSKMSQTSWTHEHRASSTL